MGYQGRIRLSRSFVIGAGIAALAGQAGCIPFAGTEFRETAIPAMQTGVTSIVNGLIDGIFAAVEVESKMLDASTTG